MSVQLVPPTINALPPQQRIRLIRSTRKLGSILGTTPQLVEEDALFEDKAYRRGGGFYAPELSPNGSIVSFTPSISSFDEPPHTTAAISFRLVAEPPSPLTVTTKKPPTLVLSVQPDEKSHRRGSITSFSPIHMTFSTSSPISPPTATADAFGRDFRRRRMDKLTRTLGENIPPELVFPNLTQEKSLPPVSIQAPSGARSSLRQSRGRSWSVGTSSSSAAGLLPAAVIPTAQQYSSRAAPHSSMDASRPSFDQHARESLAFSRTCTPTPPPSIQEVMQPPTFVGGVHAERTYSSSSSSDLASLHSLPSGPQWKPSIASSIARSASAKVSGRLRSNTVGKTKGKKEREMLRRKELEWEGEWNRQDMDQVVTQLRNLRSK